MRRTTSLLGVVSESGALVYEYQQILRKKEIELKYKNRPDFFGGILWYLADIATIFGFSLDEISKENLVKVNDLFGQYPVMEGFFDTTRIMA